MENCHHKNVVLINPYELIRKYRCQICGEVMMCACDKEIGTKFLSHQIRNTRDFKSQKRVIVTLGFLKDICNECRGLNPESYPVGEIYGRTSKIHRYYWREISFETMKRFANISNCPDHDVVTEMAMNKKLSNQIEKEVIKEIKELHKTAPKYKYMQESAAEVIEKYNVKLIELKANYVKTKGRKAKIEKNGFFYSAEEFAEQYLQNKGFDVIHSESVPFHVLFGTFLWMVIQDGADEKCRIVGFGDRIAFENRVEGSQIWTQLPEDFGTPTYYQRRRNKIDEHFESFPQKKEDLIWLFDYWTGYSADLRQYLWAHREEDITTAKRILNAIPVDKTYDILKYLVEDYWGRYLGWPDIIACKGERIEFFEVKSSKDKLSEDQKNWIKGNSEILKLPFSIIKIHKNKQGASTKLHK